MPTLSERPPTPSSRPSRRRFLSADEDVRSLQAGLLLTLIFWPLIVWIFGLALRHLGHSGSSRSMPAPKPTFSIELEADKFPLAQKAPPPPPDRFVETNPDAPENTPDKTRNFAARNQQVAQEKPAPENKSDTPQLEGKKDREATQIVSGDLKQPELEPQPAPPPTPVVNPSTAQAEARREENPLPGTEKVEGDNKDGFGANIAKNAENATSVPERVEGVKNAPIVVGNPQPMQPKIDPQRPQPRRRIERNVRPAVLAENKLGTSNIGPIAIDARWSQYGEYIQKLIETVQVQWERINDQSRVYPPPGTTVTVKFRLEGSEGAVAEIISSDTNGGTQAERACISAITARSPYGKWTDDMVAVLGEAQEMTFTFYYY